MLPGELPAKKDGVKGATNSHPVEVKITLRDFSPFALFVIAFSIQLKPSLIISILIFHYLVFCLRLDLRDQPLFLPCLIGRHLNLLHLQHMVPSTSKKKLFYAIYKFYCYVFFKHQIVKCDNFYIYTGKCSLFFFQLIEKFSSFSPHIIHRTSIERPSL